MWQQQVGAELVQADNPLVGSPMGALANLILSRNVHELTSGKLRGAPPGPQPFKPC